MIKGRLLIFLLLLSTNIFGQSYLGIEINSHEIDLKDWEVNPLQKKEIISRAKRSVDNIVLYENEIGKEIPLDNYHILDFNKDGYLDVILSYHFGSEILINHFISYDGSNYNKDFTTYGAIVVNTKISSSLPFTFYSIEYPCCAETVTTYNNYVVIKSLEETKNYLLSSDLIIEGVQIPNFNIKRPYKVINPNKKYNLRFTPEIIKEKFNTEEHELVTNILGSIDENTEALVLSEKMDSTGRVWYFCKINVSAISFIEPYDYLKGNTSTVLSWISGRYVNKIQQ